MDGKKIGPEIVANNLDELYYFINVAVATPRFIILSLSPAFLFLCIYVPSSLYFPSFYFILFIYFVDWYDTLYNRESIRI